jgi:hypothetical protein
VAEALRALHAVETCKEMGFYDIILEEDALQIVDVIKTHVIIGAALVILWMTSNWSKAAAILAN